jgi:hypothetical protein
MNLKNHPNNGRKFVCLFLFLITTLTPPNWVPPNNGSTFLDFNGFKVYKLSTFNIRRILVTPKTFLLNYECLIFSSN